MTQAIPPNTSPSRSGCTRASSSPAAGELDYTSAGLVHRQVKDAWQTTDSAGLVLDLKGVTFCDSMGVGVLVLLLRQSREQQRNLALSGIPPLRERILTITGLRTAFQVETSVEEAIQTVQASPQPDAPTAPAHRPDRHSDNGTMTPASTSCRGSIHASELTPPASIGVPLGRYE
ncbi:STAS domain-containing protein [Nonomuraea sp. NN258]|uniref:STAS domain-containing protein n=1 Tax=Nonomuraea antri TaxID=2730852 RepID=UPI00156815C4|nr:STAS domain-containing protein [Nonomuraea antri]NRQ30609.1 STAS domain-containing protein [Nonomuraea antri]